MQRVIIPKMFGYYMRIRFHIHQLTKSPFRDTLSEIMELP
jgi:hypothetical protein